MATASTTTTRRRTQGDTTATTKEIRGLGLEAAHDAQEAFGRSSRATLDTLSTFSEVGQRVNREFADFMTDGGKEALKLWAEMQGTWLDSMRTALGGLTNNAPMIDAWEKLLDGNTRAFGRYAEVVQQTAEKGTDRIKEAVDAMADQVKESSGQLASIADVVDVERSPTNGRSSRAN